MNTEQWTHQCGERLHEQWPTVERSDLEHLAKALLTEDRWKQLPPADAALQWLLQGIPETASRTAGDTRPVRYV